MKFSVDEKTNLRAWWQSCPLLGGMVDLIQEAQELHHEHPEVDKDM